MENFEDSYKLECLSAGDYSLLHESGRKSRKDSSSNVSTSQSHRNHSQSFDSHFNELDCCMERNSSTPPPPSGTFSPSTPSIAKELKCPLVLEGPSLFTTSLSPDVDDASFSLLDESGKNPPSSPLSYSRGQNMISGLNSSSRVRLTPLRRNGNSSFTCTIWEKKLSRPIPLVPEQRNRCKNSQLALEVESSSTLPDSDSLLRYITLSDVEHVVSFVMDRILSFVSFN